jgi:hypothetical protein
VNVAERVAVEFVLLIVGRLVEPLDDLSLLREHVLISTPNCFLGQRRRHYGFLRLSDGERFGRYLHIEMSRFRILLANGRGREPVRSSGSRIL